MKSLMMIPVTLAFSLTALANQKGAKCVRADGQEAIVATTTIYGTPALKSISIGSSSKFKVRLDSLFILRDSEARNLLKTSEPLQALVQPIKAPYDQLQVLVSTSSVRISYGQMIDEIVDDNAGVIYVQAFNRGVQVDGAILAASAGIFVNCKAQK